MTSHDNVTDIVERLSYLHVWPQSIGSTYADTVTARQIERLYDVGNVATEAAEEIISLRKQLENARSEALEEAATLADEWRAENKQSALDAKKQGNHQFSAELETAAKECNALQAAIRKLKGQPDNKPSGIPVDSPTSIQHDKSGYTP